MGWANAIAVVGALMCAPAAAEESVLRIDSRPEVKEVMVITPGKSATALTPSLSKASNVVIMLNGGSGQVWIGKAPDGPDAGKLKVGGSMPIVARQALADKVGAVAILTQPSDRPVMDQVWRDSREHVTDVAAAVTVVQQRFPGAKVWLLGISNGAWSAARAGTALQDRLAGVVLMSVAGDALTAPGFASIRIPVLIVQHRRDSCLPYRNIEEPAKWHTLVTVEDARLPRVGPVKRDCGPESAHNFYGSEAAVMAAVTQWIETGTAPANIDEETAKRSK